MDIRGDIIYYCLYLYEKAFVVHVLHTDRSSIVSTRYFDAIRCTLSAQIFCTHNTFTMFTVPGESKEDNNNCPVVLVLSLSMLQHLRRVTPSRVDHAVSDTQ